MVNIVYQLTQLSLASTSSHNTTQIKQHCAESVSNITSNKTNNSTRNLTNNLASMESLHTQTTPLFHYRSGRSYPGCGVYKALDDVRLVLQVHDELVFEVRQDLLPMVRLF